MRERCANCRAKRHFSRSCRNRHCPQCQTRAQEAWQTNGVAERFDRTLKEQAIHGCIFKNVEEVRAAVTDFKDRYNRHWRLEKLGFMPPHEARQANAMRKVA